MPYLMISAYSWSFPLLSLHFLNMTEASTLAGEKVLGSLSREITLSTIVLRRKEEPTVKLHVRRVHQQFLRNYSFKVFPLKKFLMQIWVIIFEDLWKVDYAILFSGASVMAQQVKELATKPDAMRGSLSEKDRGQERPTVALCSHATTRKYKYTQ